MRFDGRGFADKIVVEIKERVAGMARKPKLVSFYDARNVGAVKYTDVKSRFAKRVGVDFEQIPRNNNQEINKTQIVNLNKQNDVDGVMVQVPFPDSAELVKLIDPKKDVDGLLEGSLFQPAVVRAVMAILGCLQEDLLQRKICVVGAKGFVGRRLMRELMRELRITNYELLGMDKDDFDPEKLKKADVVISCTGQAGLIKPEMVKEGFVAIDVGYPKAEFTTEALERASFYTPVPGGVGPVTVACLFKNLVEG
ncbi:bifunctional 5,10-methylenetetrahydrofolate dehydrogenase/5,10-methenyltetrahydrofolate cyclohydrolase [Candidatus Amesbacteria bacterium]|nr:bifunctional 5,10-methylenetetrahydrofolate dehydrogenase/5,10-methenyltetrahydrofolate cyclohydrolase [Candidatus Amesbacteria bacterium]MBI2587437.1 bifunctional 5,10-methylenetetrahydrofolate dehydrogenase/5,10-methenyltetrahydrofolate cyclohydrolase [Candidatus Amesbacteria bacterium]